MNVKNVKWSVNFYGSNPDAQNDDCWTGADFDTAEKAEEVYNALGRGDATCLTDEIDPKGFLRRTYVQDTAYVELGKGEPSDGESRATYEPIVARRVPHADGVERRSQRNAERADREWKREQAMQAGMGMGVDAYNDEMGY